MAEGLAVSSPTRDRGADDAARSRSAPTASAAPAAPPAKTIRRGSPGGARTGRGITPANKRAFRLPEVVLGVLLVAGCALGAVLWQRSATSTTTVVVASRTIPRGTVIGADDLRGAQLGGETSALISGDSARALLGKIALVDIGADVPLNLSMLTDAEALAADEGLSSMALGDGDFPPDLATNDDVRVLVTGRPDATGSAITTLLDEVAVVWAVEASSDGASTIVTVRGSLALATAIAAASDVHIVRVETVR